MRYFLSNRNVWDNYYLLKDLSHRLQKLLHQLAFHKKIIGAFAPLNEEPFWPQFLGDCCQTAFPAQDGEIMIFKKSLYSNLVLKKEFGIKMLIPKEDDPIVTPEILLVPGLAFDEQGHRLGRGGGFYDKYCKTFHESTIGLCWENQVLNHLPSEDHDMTVDYVVTNASTYHKGRKVHFTRGVKK